jgi:hypothetical protein
MIDRCLADRLVGAHLDLPFEQRERLVDRERGLGFRRHG